MKKNLNENSKQKIISIATKFFVTKGFDGTSIRDICKQANINISMISYYFGGKLELYQNIIDNLIDKQTEFAKTIIDFDIDLDKISKKEKIKMLLNIATKAIDFFYSSVTEDLMLFIVQEQYNRRAKIYSPTLNFIKKLIASIYNKKETDKEILLKTTYLISQVGSPRVFSNIFFEKSNVFTKQDIKLIKDNLTKYIKFMF